MDTRIAICHCFVIGISLLIAPSAATARAAEPEAPKLFQPMGEGGFVVEARVVALKSTKERLDETRFYESFFGTLKITHVFCGRPDAMGAEFVVRCFKEPEMDFTGRDLKPPLLEPGEIGLWVLSEVPTGKLHAATRCELGSDFWPMRKGINPRYEEAKKLAQAIEKVARAPSRADQLLVLQRLATNRDPGISKWAIRSLAWTGRGGWTDAERGDFLDRLVEDEQARLPVAGQVAVDNALLELRKEWRTSPQRLKLLKKWVSSRLSAEDASEMVGQLDWMCQQPSMAGLEMEQLLALIKTAIENEGLPLGSRVGAVERVFWMQLRHRRFDDDRPAFEFLVDVVKHGKAPELRVKAASYLGVFLTNDTEWRWAVVNELRRTSTDEKLSEALDRSLRPPVKRKLSKSLDVNGLE